MESAAKGFAGLLKDLHGELRERKQKQEELEGQVKELTDNLKELKDEALLQTAVSATQNVEVCELQASLDAERAARIHFEDNYNFVRDNQEGFVYATTQTIKATTVKTAEACEEILDETTALFDKARITLVRDLKEVAEQQLNLLNNRKRSTSPTFDEQPGGDLKRLDQA